MKLKINRLGKRSIWLAAAMFALLNVVAIFHSYRFTHFSKPDTVRTNDPKKLTTIEKVKTLAFGVSNPRPTNIVQPVNSFEKIRLKSNKEIECWFIQCDNAKGTIILFHGYGG